MPYSASSKFLFVPVVCGAVACGPLADNHAVQEVAGITQAASFFAPELGKGVDAAETRTYLKCVTYSNTQSEKLPFHKRLYQDYSVNSRQELDAKLDISASVNAKALWGEGGAGVSYFKDKEFREDGFYWVVDANYELEHESLPTNAPDFGLTKRAKQLLATQGMEGFVRACGTHFYAGRTLGARFVMLYEFRSHRDRFVDNIKATARAKSNFGLDGEAELAHAINAAARSAVVKVSSEVTGGDASLDEYAGDPNTLKGELLKLRMALEGGQGTVLEWEMVPYDVFEEVQAAERTSGYTLHWDSQRKDALDLYYNRFVANKQAISRVDVLLARAEGSSPYVYLSAAKRRTVESYRASLQKQNDAITHLARRCLTTLEPCEINSVPKVIHMSPADLAPDRDFSGLGDWGVVPYQRRDSLSAIDFFATPADGSCKVRFFSTGNDVIANAQGIFVQLGRGPFRKQMVPIGTGQLIRDGAKHYAPNICMGEFASRCSMRLIEDFDNLLEDGCPQPRLELSIYDDAGFCTDRRVFRMFE